MADFLGRILERKRHEVAALARTPAREALERSLASAPPPRDFRAALQAGRGLRIIAEIKKASPSRGVLSPDFDPARQAAWYQEGGACALSVLTDEEFFQGSPLHLQAARKATGLPVLRKDFILDPAQVEEARGMGADAVLLIAAILPRALLDRLLQQARDLGMAALVEVHSAAELAASLDAGADLIGVNNRDLRTLQVDRSVSLNLAPRFPAGVIRVSESGITGKEDLEVLCRAGYQAFLVGETLMTAPDPRRLIREWTR